MKYSIGIDLGGTNLKVALLNEKSQIREKQVLKTQHFANKQALISAITYSVDKIVKENGLNKKNILGVGLGVPGPTDTVRGIVHFFPNIPGWKEVNLKNILEKKLHLRVFVDNDAKLMSLAEFKLGRGKGFENVMFITLGTGVGGAIVLGGRLYRGLDNAAGEIGHLPINELGPRCNCNGIACLESYVGNNRILAQAKSLFGRDISLEEMSALAGRKNKKALFVWDQAGQHLGVALTAAVNLLNLDAVVIGGGVANAGKVLFDKIKQTLAIRAMKVQVKRVKVLKAKLGSDAGMIGAAIMVKERLER